MNQTFHLPSGISITNEPSGTVFIPQAGYTMTSVVGEKWKWVYRVACSVELIAPLMSSLVEVCLPESQYMIITGHWFGDEPETYLSDFLLRTSLEATIAPHLSLLIDDGMVGYGFAWYDEYQHEEIFLDDHKELTVFTSKPKATEDILASYGLFHVCELEFISEHGHGHLSLGGMEATYCHQLIRQLNMERVSTTVGI